MSRPGSRGFTITPNSVIDHARDLSDGQKMTLILIRSLADNATGLLTMSYAQLSERRGKAKQTVERHLKALDEGRYIQTTRHYDYATGSWGPSTYRIIPPSERQESSTLSVENKTTFEGRGGVKNEASFNQNTLIMNTEVQVHTPSGVSVCVDFPIPVLSPEPPRPEPSPEVYASEQLGRELRRQRHSEHRQAHYREVRASGPRRRCAPPAALTPAHVAANEILRLCGVSGPSARLLSAMVEALDLQVAIGGKTPRHWVEDAVLNWRTYREHQGLLFKVGLERFFGDGLWCNTGLWHYDHAECRRLQRFF